MCTAQQVVLFDQGLGGVTRVLAQKQKVQLDWPKAILQSSPRRRTPQHVAHPHAVGFDHQNSLGALLQSTQRLRALKGVKVFGCIEGVVSL
jgi:hypothetical protein